jgi:hypothetical protein
MKIFRVFLGLTFLFMLVSTCLAADPQPVIYTPSGTLGFQDITLDEATRVLVDATGKFQVVSFPSQTLVRKETSQALTAGPLAYTSNFAAKTRIKTIALKSSQAISETVTFTFNSKTNATYDTILKSETFIAESNMLYIPAGDLVLENGDEIDVSCTNVGLAGTVYVTLIGETLQ